MLKLKEADPVSWDLFLTQLLRDTRVIPPRFFKDKTELVAGEALRRLGMGYLQILAEDDPQSIITRLEETQNEGHPQTYAS